MPRKRKAAPKREYEFLSIKVTGFAVGLDYGIDYKVWDEKHRQDKIEVFSYDAQKA